MAYDEESLRGYSLKIHLRDSFVCCYCGLDGKKSLDSWVTLTRDHLLPPDDPDRDNVEYICTACSFCNTVDNHYFERMRSKGITLHGLSRPQLIEKRKSSVLEKRKEFQEFWTARVAAVHA